MKHAAGTAALRVLLVAAAAAGACPAQEPAASAPEHAGPVAALAWLPDGRPVAASPAALELDGERRDAPFRITCVRAGGTANAPWLLAGGGRPARPGVVALWRGAAALAGPPTQRWTVGDDQVHAVATAPGRPLVACGGIDGRVRLLDLDAPDAAPLTLDAHTAPVRALAFSPDGTRLASAGLDGALIFTAFEPDAPPRRLALAQDHTDGVECVVWTADGRLLSGARDGKVRLHRRDGRLLRTWQRLGGRVLSLAVSTPGPAWIGLDDGRVLRLDDLDGDPRPWRRFETPVFALAPAPDGRRLAVGLRGGYVLRQLDGSQEEDRQEEAGR